MCKKCRGKRIVKEKKRVEFFVERGMHPDDTVVLKGEGDELVRLEPLEDRAD